METTKITVKVWVPLLTSFSKRVCECFLKRDALLNKVIAGELEHLRTDLEGNRLSAIAKRYVSNEFNRLETKTINVVVDKSTSQELKKIAEENNLVRDAFINRLMLFLVAPDDLLSYLDLPTHIDSSIWGDWDTMPTTAMGGIKSIISDPFFFLRETLKDEKMEPIYRLEIPKIGAKNMIGLSCFLEDDQVPDTEAYKQRLALEKEKFSLFDLPIGEGDRNV